MLNFLDPSTLARTYRDPVSWIILAVDLFPIWAVLTMGWGAAPLVFLYWLENLIIGAVALARMMATSAKESPIGMVGMAFIGPFFIVHYGMFCFVHGVFVNTFVNLNSGNAPGFPSPIGLIDAALQSGNNMTTFVLVIIALQILLFVTDFIRGGEYRRSTVDQEMKAPYARIIVLHIGIFAGAGAMAAFGEPLWGILGLIGLRAVWGVFLSVRRRLRLDDAMQLKS
ncbi:MAG: DUF6498-containing protein [Pseudomonadota bacterium]